MSGAGGEPGAAWFADDALLEAEVRRSLAAAGAVPAIPGYDDLRELARGGQGIVYSAVQRSTRRVVAVKVLREAPADEERRRFEREIDLAAALRHPNVVALYDSGQTADGRPFLVMELVDGVTIDAAPEVAAARASRLAPADRAALLRLFAAVCDGVCYAHQRGIVHRDLKPSNIRIDPDGRPKVLDFGLAKSLAAPADELTDAGSGSPRFLGSLPWASPEQAAGKVAAIDVRTDVHALGLVLYHLLTGGFPYDVRADLRTLLAQIVDAPPLPPSRLARGIDADLETIVLRCLDKLPERRYQTAGDLARDVRRLLAGEAIEARRDSSWYVLRMAARRHRAAVGFTALLLLVIFASLAVALLLWRRAERGRDDAVAAQQRAEAALGFLVDTLTAVDPDRQGRDTKMIEVVDRAAADLPQRFGNDAPARVLVHSKLAELYRNLSALPQAEQQAAAAVQVARAWFGADDPRTLVTRANLAALQHLRGRSAEVLAEVEDLARRARLVRLEPAAAMQVCSALGQCLLAVGRDRDAEAAFAEALTQAEAAEREQDAATARENLAAVAGRRGDFQGAALLLREVLAVRERALGPAHSATRRSRANMAYYLGEAGDLVAAEALTSRCLEDARRLSGQEGLDTLSWLNNHAQLLEKLGQLEAAEQEMRACLDGRLRTLGEDHPHTLVTRNNLAHLALRRGDHATAEAESRHILAVRERTLGAAHQDTLISRNNLANVLRTRGRQSEAIAELRATASLAEQHLGATHWLTALFAGNLADGLLADGLAAEAEPLARRALSVLEERLGKDHQHAVKAQRTLDAVLQALGRTEEPVR